MHAIQIVLVCFAVFALSRVVLRFRPAPRCCGRLRPSRAATIEQLYLQRFQSSEPVRFTAAAAERAFELEGAPPHPFSILYQPGSGESPSSVRIASP
jgi:hypothetical protein